MKLAYAYSIAKKKVRPYFLCRTGAAASTTTVIPTHAGIHPEFPEFVIWRMHPRRHSGACTPAVIPAHAPPPSFRRIQAHAPPPSFRRMHPRRHNSGACRNPARITIPYNIMKAYAPASGRRRYSDGSDSNCMRLHRACMKTACLNLWAVIFTCHHP